MVRILGLDIGDKRIGVALSDLSGILASPHSVIERTDEVQDVTAIAKIIDQYQVRKIIVGLPITMQGDVGEQAVKVQAFTDRLAHHIDVPLEFRDERMTTISARRLMQESRRKKIKQKKTDDSQAAAVILQGYLDEKDILL